MTANNDTDIAGLADQIQHHDALYWKKNVIEISDADYDTLRARLKALAPDHPVLQKTGEELRKNEETVRHAAPMLSIEKSLVPGEVEKWATDAGAFSGGAPEDGLVAAYKVDGSSCSLVYDNGSLIQAATRGDGRVGNLITRNVLQIADIPKRLPHAEHSGRVEVRGEIYMSRESFAKAVANFERLLAEGEAKEDERPPNARNYCAGTLMQKDPRDVAKRGLSFMAHGCVGKIPGADGLSEMSNFAALKKLGFHTPFFKHVTEAIQIAGINAAIDAQRDALPYDTDGVVYTINRLALHAELGATSHHPRYRIAFKFGREQGETTVVKILWNTSRSGRVCPTMLVEPIHLGGATITLCTVHNAKRVMESNVAAGDTVLLEREVIPYFVKKVSGVESNAGSLPSTCPSCGATLVWDDTDTNLMCLNLGGCKSQLQDYFGHYVSRKAANIDGIGTEWIIKMLDAGLLNSPADFFKLMEEQLLKLRKQTKLKPNNSKKIIEKSIVENLDKSPEQWLETFLASLKIKGLGSKASATLANYLGSFDKVQGATPGDLIKILGVNEPFATVIVNGIQNRNNIEKTIVENIDKSREQTLETFLVSLGIKGLGSSVAAKLASHLDSLEKVQAATPDNLMKIDGIAETLAAGIVNGLHNRAGMIAELKKYIILKEVKKSGGVLSGKSFCLTGHVEFQYSRKKYDSRPDIEALIVSKGGIIKEVSKKLDFLVVGENAGGKRAKAEKLEVKILDIHELVSMLDGRTTETAGINRNENNNGASQATFEF